MTAVRPLFEQVSDTFAMLAAFEFDHWTQVADLCEALPAMLEDASSMIARLSDRMNELPVSPHLPAELDELSSRVDDTASWCGDLAGEFGKIHEQAIELSARDHGGGFWSAG